MKTGTLFCFAIAIAFQQVASFPKIGLSGMKLFPGNANWQASKTHHASSFHQWFDEMGVKKDDIRISISKEDGKSLPCALANRDLVSGDLLLSLPLGMVLDAAAAESKLGALIKTSSLKSGSIGMISLLLLFEKSLGTASKYASYIAALPQSPPNIISWSQNYLEKLSQSTTRRVMAQINAINADIDFIVNTESPLLPKDVFTRDALLWAIGTVKSRYVIVQGSPTLVPGSRITNLFLIQHYYEKIEFIYGLLKL